jgi:hypothetical protein
VAPAVLVGDTNADRAFPNPPAVVATAARDALFADPGKDGWGEGLGDDLARAVSP